jgi:3,4-dihydroxy 2-butanone 4-phosphate synthase/GTP cyclohydrolase II
MAKHGRGLICLALTNAKADSLLLHPMSPVNTSPFQTAFTVSIEARCGVTTGISAADRATTIQTALRDDCRPDDLARPGHVFPLRARDGGVLVRAGQTEGIVDLTRLASMKPAGVICEIMNEDGTMARMPQLEEFAKQFDLKIISIAEVIKYRHRNERLVERLVTVKLPTQFGDFDMHLYKSQTDEHAHLALTKGGIGTEDAPKDLGGRAVLVRVHSECLTGDVFHSKRCDCGDQLQTAMEMVGKEGVGVILYMRQEGRGIGLENKLLAYKLQEDGMDTVDANVHLGFPADLRDYGIGAQILADLGIKNIRLLTNNPRKIVALEGYDLHVVERVPLVADAHEHNIDYLKAKRDKLGHLLEDL